MSEPLTFEQYSRKRNLTHFDPCVAKEAWDARQPEIDALTAERDALRDKQYIPGQWRCLMCGFQLSSNNLYVNSGTVGPNNNQPEPCPNDGNVMVRVTWEERVNEFSDRLSEEIPRNRELTEQRDALKRELEVAQSGCAEMSDLLVRFEAFWCGTKTSEELNVSVEVSRKIRNNPGAPLIAELTKLREVVKAGDELAEGAIRTFGEHDTEECLFCGVRSHGSYTFSNGEVSHGKVCRIAAYLAAKSALEVKPLDRILNGRTAKIDPQDIGSPMLREDK